MTSIDALKTAMGLSKYAIGSYTGTGAYGSNNKNSIITNFIPGFSIILSADNNAKPGILILSRSLSYGTAIFGNYNAYNTQVIIQGDQAVITTVSSAFTSNSLSWYSSTYANYQFNEYGIRYEYIVFENAAA